MHVLLSENIFPRGKVESHFLPDESPHQCKYSLRVGLLGLGTSGSIITLIPRRTNQKVVIHREKGIERVRVYVSARESERRYESVEIPHVMATNFHSRASGN